MTPAVEASRPLTVMLGTIGRLGHLFPLLALGRSLRERGHRVVIETFERWREVSEGLGLELVAGPESVAFPSSRPLEPGMVTTAEAVAGSARTIRELRPDIVVCDLFSLIPALAADLEGVPRASLIPHPYPHPDPGMPPFNSGFRAPRTALGGAFWELARRSDSRARRRALALMNGERAALGLSPIERASGMTSERLALVATFPQLEHEGRLPGGAHLVGPLPFELEHPDVPLPSGDRPLVLVAASTAQDRRHRMVSAALAGLAGEPVRVLATLNERGARWSGELPANASVVDWVSYRQVMPAASLVVCRGGHGTIARALGAGVPVLVCPFAGDQSENGIRVSLSGAGAMLPNRLLGARSLRTAVRLLLGEPRFAAAAGAIAAWARENDGARRAAELVERLAAEAQPSISPR